MKEIKDKVNEIAKLWNEKYSLLNESGINESNIVCPDTTLKTLNDKLVVTSEIIINIEIEEAIITNILKEWISKIDNFLNNIITHISEIQTIIDSINTNEGIKSYDDTTFQITHNNDSVNKISTPFLNLHTTCNQIIEQIVFILPFSKFQSFNDLFERIQTYQALINHLLSIKTYITHEKENTEKEIKFINEFKESIELLESEINQIKKDYGEEYKKIKESSADTEAKIAHIKEITKNSQTLETTINTYQSSFDTYTKQINERLKKWDEIQTLIDTSNINNQKRETEIDSLTKISESLIKGATISGLATSFNKQYKRYKRELIGARWGFYFSILLLFISVLPLVLYILPKEISEQLPTIFKLPNVFKLFFKVSKANSDIHTFGIIVRFLILIPPTWLTKFTSRRYRELFILREEYAHKSTIAQSIYGFKKEAQKYEDEITAGAFLELNRKPNITHEKISSKDEKYENPIIEILRNFLSKAADIFTKKEN